MSFLCDEKQRDIILFILCSLSNRGASDSAAFAALFAALLPFCSGASERECRAVLLTSHSDCHSANLVLRIAHVALEKSQLEEQEWLDRDWLTSVSPILSARAKNKPQLTTTWSQQRHSCGYAGELLPTSSHNALSRSTGRHRSGRYAASPALGEWRRKRCCLRFLCARCCKPSARLRTTFSSAAPPSVQGSWRCVWEIASPLEVYGPDAQRTWRVCHFATFTCTCSCCSWHVAEGPRSSQWQKPHPGERALALLV